LLYSDCEALLPVHNSLFFNDGKLRTSHNRQTSGRDLPRTSSWQDILITGPSSDSIGAETATSLACGSPAKIILLNRSIDKIQPVIDYIKVISPDTQASFVQVSLESLNSIRSAAEKILRDPSIDKIDVLINNAGIMAAPYAVTEDGIESHFQINHLAHFLLTALLLPKITAPESLGRVVNVSSYGNIFSDVRNDHTFDGGESYNPWLAYGQSKTANILHAVALNQRYHGRGLGAFAVNPGSVPTNLRRFMTPETMQAGMALHKEYGVAPPARKTLQQGCATTLRATLDPDLSCKLPRFGF